MRKLRAADLFCGAGGSTTGAEQSGMVDVAVAINHWRTAVFSHQTNHPGTRHICCRIDDIDPRNDDLPDLDLLMASPECTHFANARGGAPINDQKRATPWHVLHWAEAKRPKWVVVENVSEFRDWGPLGKTGRPLKSRKGDTYRAWLKSFESLGYQVDAQLLNAADYGAATKRTRLFIVARRGNSRQDIPWPERTHAGRWRGAHEIIDWSLPCPSIFGRKRPLRDNTLRRIEAGLRKFVGAPFLVDVHNGSGADRTNDARDPLRAIVAKPGLSVAVPFLVKYHGGQGKGDRTHDPREPLRTIDTQPRFGLASAFMMDVNHAGADSSRCRPLDAPCAAVTTKRGQAIIPFLVRYNGTGTAVSVADPLGAVTSRERFGLAAVSLAETMQELGVVDIGFRMLQDDELAAAQGFPPGYHLHGNKADRIRQIGNAVCPPVMKAICGAIAA